MQGQTLCSYPRLEMLNNHFIHGINMFLFILLFFICPYMQALLTQYYIFKNTFSLLLRLLVIRGGGCVICTYRIIGLYTIIIGYRVILCIRRVDKWLS